MNEVVQNKDFEDTFGAYERSISLAAQSVAGEFSRFVEEFGREYRSARQQRVFTTPNLSVLQVFGLTTRELRHSAVVEWFLREDAEHEQGDLFLRALLECLELSVPKQISYVVEREKHENIDISAYAPGVFAIFIENKIRDRKEEEKQFERLVKSLIKFSATNGIPEDAQIAVFLTDDGRPPDTAPKFSKVTMRNMSRVKLFGFFAGALQTAPAKSPLLSQLLNNYLREIKLLAPIL